MKPFATLLSIVIACIFCYGQHQFVKYPKLSQDEVKTMQPEIQNSEIPAEVLYRSVSYVIDEYGTINKEYFEKVKIYNKDQAKDYYDHEIYLYDESGGPRETLSGLKAYTHNFENGQIVSTKVEKDSKFRSKENKNVTVVKFTFPNVKNGSVLEYTYKVSSPSEFLTSIPKFVLEEKIPIRYVEYVLDAPDVLGYNINFGGAQVPKHRCTEAKNIYGGNYYVYRFGYENIPAFKDEEFVLNQSNYKTVIRAELNSTNFRNVFKSYAVKWDDIAERLKNHDYFGEQIKRKGLVKNILPASIIEIPSAKERAEAIFRYVQKNYNWNESESVFTSEKGIANLISTKVGNSAEINLLLLMLLRNAGLSADPIVSATIDRGMLYGYSPSLSALNYVFVSLQLDGKNYLMDATSKFSNINMPPPRVLNYNGILIKENGSHVVDISYPDVSETELVIEAKLNADGTFDGKFSDKDTKLYAMMVNDEFMKSKDEYVKTYKDKYKFSLANIKPQLLENGDFETTLDFSSDTFTDAIGNKLVFNPLLFLYSQSHDFNQKEERRAPLEFISAFKRSKKVTITLPEGYVFENIPTSKKMKTEDNEISYSYITTKKAPNILTVEAVVTISKPSFPKEYYPAFTQVYNAITKLEGQVVTAVKK